MLQSLRAQVRAGIPQRRQTGKFLDQQDRRKYAFRGKESGVYGLRWMLASDMQAGEISEIFVAGQNMLVMKCLEREDSGYVPLEGVRGVLESQIRTESTRYMRENPGMPIQGVPGFFCIRRFLDWTAGQQIFKLDLTCS